jgi:hypothetical protein
MLLLLLVLLLLLLLGLQVVMRWVQLAGGCRTEALAGCCRPCQQEKGA